MLNIVYYENRRTKSVASFPVSHASKSPGNEATKSVLQLSAQHYIHRRKVNYTTAVIELVSQQQVVMVAYHPDSWPARPVGFPLALAPC